MKTDESAVVQAKFSAALAAHFCDLAAKTNLRVDDAGLSAVWEQGVFVGASGAYPKIAKGGSQNVGLIQISTPKNLPLLTQENAKVPPGDYVVHLGANGSISLKKMGSHNSIPVAPAGTAGKATGGGNPTCSRGYRIEVGYRNCQVCITLVCPGKDVRLLTCFRIPFCDLVTGLFDA